MPGWFPILAFLGKQFSEKILYKKNNFPLAASSALCRMSFASGTSSQMVWFFRKVSPTAMGTVGTHLEKVFRGFSHFPNSGDLHHPRIWGTGRPGDEFRGGLFTEEVNYDLKMSESSNLITNCNYVQWINKTKY